MKIPVCDKHNVKKIKKTSRRLKRGYFYTCPVCKKEYASKWYKKNYQKNKKELNKKALNYYYKKRQWYQNLKKKCQKCNETHPAVLVFHHKTGIKEKAVSSMIFKSKKKILEEIKKCEILCFNCHSKLHYNLNNKGR